MALTQVQSGMMDSIAQYNSFKNRIINGAMVIDQRNNGASITAVDSGYSLDRWLTGSNIASKFSVQRNAGSVTPPAGFVNYLGVTSLSAYTPVTIDSFSIQQRIEGFNTLDFNYGTASAVTSTLSFWVRSSLTGTFGGQIFGSASRSFPFSYSIPVANTWTFITITVAGDTVAALNQSNSYGLIVVFGLGSVGGGTVNTWQNGNFTQPAGCVNVVSTNGATWYVTGVQLEKGSTATAFDYRPYGTELQLCQRYYWKTYDQSVVPGTVTRVGGFQLGSYSNTATGMNNGVGFRYPVVMRGAPSLTAYDPDVANTTGFGRWDAAGVAATQGAITLSAVGDGGTGSVTIATTGRTAGAGLTILFHLTANAEL
jgi:hypothetical protein